jgi:hypothetical protein
MANSSASLIAAIGHLRQRPIWRLVAAENAPVWIGLLQTHLYSKERVLPSSILHERVGIDIGSLRNQGVDLPQDAKHYIAWWVREGWVERRLPANATEEEYELSTAAIDAIRFASSIQRPHASATESRLNLVMQAIAGLAEDTEVDREARIAKLREEQERIQREIDAIENGQMRVLSGDAAVERILEIIALGADIAEDFRRVRESFDQLNHDMRVQIMESEGSRADVLEAMFSGIDVIAQSDAGRSFNAFWRLLTDQEQSGGLQDAINEILQRDFIEHISREERQFLMRFKRTLLGQSRTVQNVMQDIARGLKSFVQTQEYSRQRHLSRVLKDAQRSAFDARTGIRPWESIGFAIDLSTSDIHSVSQYAIPDPSLHVKAGAMMEAPPAEISLESISALVSFADIDFRGLEERISLCLAEKEQVSVGQVLQKYPATQGLGSVVGLIAIGSTRGISVPPPAGEKAAWMGMDGVGRSARIPLIYFERGSFRG